MDRWWFLDEWVDKSSLSLGGKEDEGCFHLKFRKKKRRKKFRPQVFKRDCSSPNFILLLFFSENEETEEERKWEEEKERQGERIKKKGRKWIGVKRDQKAKTLKILSSENFSLENRRRKKKKEEKKEEVRFSFQNVFLGVFKPWTVNTLKGDTSSSRRVRKRVEEWDRKEVGVRRKVDL